NVNHTGKPSPWLSVTHARSKSGRTAITPLRPCSLPAAARSAGSLLKSMEVLRSLSHSLVAAPRFVCCYRLPTIKEPMRKNPKVLLVEDDESLAASLQLALEVTGYSVQMAERVEQGLASAEQEDFDVVVTDLQMPGQSGLELIEILHTTNPHLPVILMTAHHTAGAAIAATKLGAYEY